MSVHLITGYAGKEHVAAADAGSFHAGVIGSGKYVLKTGSMFAYEIENNNLIKVRDGDLLNQGRHIRIETNDYEECRIENGEQSLKRNDFIVIRYSQEEETGKEKAELVVIKGTSGVNPSDPEYMMGDLLKGAFADDFLLYRVRLNGINIEAVEPLFSEKLMPMKELISSLTAVNGTLTVHKSSSDHDGRYYTESEVNGLLSAHKSSNDHDGRYYTESEVDSQMFQRGTTLAVNGRNLQLKNASGTVLSTAVTQDTTYNFSNMIKTVNVTISSGIVIAGGKTDSIDMSYTEPDGYTLLGVTQIKSGSIDIAVTGWSFTANYVKVYLKNTATSNKTATPFLTSRWIKNSYT